MFEMLALTTLLLQAFGSTAHGIPPQLERPPYEGQWVVEIIDRIEVMPDSQVTMRIEGQTITGLASCNTYRGRFTVTGTSVQVGELLKTMKACDTARLSEEEDFLSLLRDVVHYEVQSRDSLALETSDGKTIVAKRER
ncbi:MAG TPA: META domain-containing protein [Vicinamibacterales bacterium]|nr:META domain-containing protein [Vicinamibacterales bacterium]